MHALRQSIGMALALAAGSLVACTERDASTGENRAAASAEPGPTEASNEAGALEAPPAAPAAEPDTAACQTQDGRKIAPVKLRAIGTEPFWNARIEGRCVTYSTPEDPAGTRIWTQFAGDAEGGTWSGALDGRQFELRTSKGPGCSDGMSDARYPLAVTLRVQGETRQGCAEPA